jgi:hypothetical protein
LSTFVVVDAVKRLHVTRSAPFVYSHWPLVRYPELPDPPAVDSIDTPGATPFCTGWLLATCPATAVECDAVDGVPLNRMPAGRYGFACATPPESRMPTATPAPFTGSVGCECTQSARTDGTVLSSSSPPCVSAAKSITSPRARSHAVSSTAGPRTAAQGSSGP